MKPKKRPIPITVPQIRATLQREFQDLLWLDDLKKRPEAEREQSTLSRALAALVALDRADSDKETAASRVIDGEGDEGIDAIAIPTDGTPRLYLIQAKWSDYGKGAFDVSDALKICDGMNSLFQFEFNRFNNRFQQMREEVRTLLSDPRTRFVLTIVVMRSEKISSAVERRLQDKKIAYARLGTLIDYEILYISDILELARKAIAEPRIDLSIKMEQWMQIAGPVEAFYGLVSAGEVADWYETYKDRLFAKNIRASLALTSVNAGMIETLTREPNNFWYFNNGITILCNSLEKHAWTKQLHGPVELHLLDASVVNGAQTVSATTEALSKNPDAADGYIGVRVISTKDISEEFATKITEATNKQNHVETRDFVALDRVQIEIREDFALSLQKTYTIKRGEIDPPADMGCSVVEATIGLSCAHLNPELAARAKKDTNLLWERGPEGAYDLLFKPRPTAYQIWLSVLILRKVRSVLYEDSHSRDGRVAQVAEHGDLLIAHLVFQSLDLSELDEFTPEWEELIKNVPDVTYKVLSWLIHAIEIVFDTKTSIKHLLTNPEKCRVLAENVLKNLNAEDNAPVLPSKPKKVRKSRPRSVVILVEAAAIADGANVMFQPATKAEKAALTAWLEADPRRAQATWINERSKPLLWAADGQRYSPTTLVMHICKLAQWQKAPAAVQGPKKWFVDGKSLVELADTLVKEQELEMSEE